MQGAACVDVIMVKLLPLGARQMQLKMQHRARVTS